MEVKEFHSKYSNSALTRICIDIKYLVMQISFGVDICVLHVYACEQKRMSLERIKERERRKCSGKNILLQKTEGTKMKWGNKAIPKC